jgi:Ca2+-transporting ATPase
MTTIHRIADGTLLPQGLRENAAYAAFTKGAIDGLASHSDAVWIEGRVAPMNESYRRRILEAEASLAARGMRVLGLAFRTFSEPPIKDARADEIERNLVFVGMFGMIDPPRSEVRDAVAQTREAGIRTIMITGDHPGTAVEIARQLGIQTDDASALTGPQIDKLTEEELRSVVEKVRVFARVSPEHKLRIVQALQQRGHIVSMTGDGINDAPALRKADIGVAMGLSGTDVSREASDLVLLDDNFTTIVAAVEEGRTIYENIRKFVRFSVAGNLGKVIVMLMAPFLGGPIPLLPLQLLWLNLLTDGLLGLGLGLEKTEKGTMKRPPSAPGEGIFSRGAGGETIRTGILIGSLALAVGLSYFFAGRPAWQTMIFTSLAFAQAGQALSTRSRNAAWEGRSNPVLIAMVGLTICLQLLVIYVPVLAAIFQVLPLNGHDLLLATLAGVVVFAFIEVDKLLQKQNG